MVENTAGKEVLVTKVNTTKSRFLTTLSKKLLENIAEKWRKCWEPAFSHFSTMFSTLLTTAAFFLTFFVHCKCLEFGQVQKFAIYLKVEQRVYYKPDYRPPHRLSKLDLLFASS